MKKLLIASSVMAALTMGVAHADPLTQDGGTIEFIGEITATTCWAGVDNTTETGTYGTPNSTGNLVVLAPVSKSLLDGFSGRVAGITPFTIVVAADKPATDASHPCSIGKVQKWLGGVPTNDSTPVTNVTAIFGANLTETSGTADQYDTYHAPTAKYNVGNTGNVDMSTGYLVNIANVAEANGLRNFADDLNTAANQNGAASGVALQLLDADKTPIKVGDLTAQKNNSKKHAITAGAATAMPHFVQYISTGTSVAAGNVRSFVVYDLFYE